MKNSFNYFIFLIQKLDPPVVVGHQGVGQSEHRLRHDRQDKIAVVQSPGARRLIGEHMHRSFISGIFVDRH